MTKMVANSQLLSGSKKKNELVHFFFNSSEVYMTYDNKSLNLFDTYLLCCVKKFKTCEGCTQTR